MPVVVPGPPLRVISTPGCRDSNCARLCAPLCAISSAVITRHVGQEPFDRLCRACRGDHHRVDRGDRGGQRILRAGERARSRQRKHQARAARWPSGRRKEGHALLHVQPCDPARPIGGGGRVEQTAAEAPRRSREGDRAGNVDRDEATPASPVAPAPSSRATRGTGSQAGLRARLTERPPSRRDARQWLGGASSKGLPLRGQLRDPRDARHRIPVSPAATLLAADTCAADCTPARRRGAT